MRFEEIFLPHSLRQRNRLYDVSTGSAKPIRFAHYTTAEAALQIIQSKRLWMRTSNCMADYSEVEHGHELLVKFYEKEGNRDRFKKAVDAIHQGMAANALNHIDQWWHDIRTNTFIASVCEHDETDDRYGRLSMWRAFGGSAARVALVFSVPAESTAPAALGITFTPVSYLDQDGLHGLLNEVISNIETNAVFLRETLDAPNFLSWLVALLLACVTAQKHEAFAEEREWRAIYQPARRRSELMKSSVKILAGIPQVIHEMPLDGSLSPEIADLDVSRLFDRLIIGPSHYPMTMFSGFSKALKEAGVQNPDTKIFSSTIPLRS